MGGAVFTGIAAVEIETIAGMLGIGVNADVLDGIRLMVHAAMPIRNERKAH